MAEMKFESLQERNAQLQQEAAGLRTQLKLTKKQVRQMEANESQLPGLRAEFDREQLSLQTEMAALKRQVRPGHCLIWVPILSSFILRHSVYYEYMKSL